MNRLILIIVMLTGLLGTILAQTPSYAIQQNEKEWKEYTSFQRDELLSFCGYCYAEGFYDRAILGYFQYLYRFPDDSLEALIAYRIARCYQLTDKMELAVAYFNRVREVAPEQSEIAKLAWYHMLRIFLDEQKYDTVLTLTENASDPFDLMFRGYVYMHRMEWNQARQALKAAEAKYNHTYYSRLLRPLLQAIDQADQVPRKRTALAFLAALAPGGGFAYLEIWDSAAASALSIGSLTIAGIFYRSEPKMLVPLSITGLAIYGTSIWKAVTSVRSTNRNNLQRYIDFIISRYPVSRFIELDEPEIFLK